jgi:hypothetical protein
MIGVRILFNEMVLNIIPPRSSTLCENISTSVQKLFTARGTA